MLSTRILGVLVLGLARRPDDDTIFSHGSSPGVPVFNSPCDFGACATIGYVANPAFDNNVHWSFNRDSLVNVWVLSIFQDMEVIPSSPLAR